MRVAPHLLARTKAGFTLAEMLVALTISSILAAAAVAALRAGMQVSSRTQEGPAAEQARYVLELLAGELAGMYHPNEPATTEQVEEIDDSSEGEMPVSFYTTMPGGQGGGMPGRCGRVTYVLKKQPDGKEGVLMRHEHWVAGQMVVGDALSQEVATGIGSFSLEVFDEKGKPTSPGNAEPGRLARTARVRLTWPDLSAGTSSYQRDVLITANTRVLPVDPGDNSGS